MGRNADRETGTGRRTGHGGGQGWEKGRRFTAAFRMAVQNRCAISFHEENPPARAVLARGEGNAYTARRSPRGHVIGRKRQKYAPIGRSSG